MNNLRRSAPLALVVAIGVMLLIWRFLFATTAQAEWIQWNLAYRAMGLSLAVWLVAASGVFYPSRGALRERGRELAGAFLLCVGVVWFWSRHEPAFFKVNMDEPAHASSALCMHLLGKFGIPETAFGWDGDFRIIKHTASHRSGFFAYLVSLAHDFLGYSENNPYRVNVACCIAFLMTIFAVARRITHSGSTAFAVIILAASVPLFAQTTFSAGYDICNLTLLTLFIGSILLYAERPNRRTFLFSAATAVLLALTRTESVVYSGFLGITAALIHIREKRLPEVGHAWLLAPGLLSALAVQVILTATPEFLSQYDLRAEGGMFSWRFFSEHAEAASCYFFAPDTYGTGFAPLAWLGLIGAGVSLSGKLTGRLAWGATEWVIAGYTLVCCGFYCMTLASFWGGPDVAVMTRFTLPVWLALLLYSMKCLGLVNGKSWRSRTPWLAFAAFCWWSVPAVVSTRTTKEMYKSRMQAAAVRICRDLNDGETTFIADSHLPYIAARIPAYSFQYFCRNAAKFETAYRIGLMGRFVLLRTEQKNGVGDDFGFGRDVKISEVSTASSGVEKRVGSAAPHSSPIRPADKDATGSMRMLFKKTIPGRPDEFVVGYLITAITLPEGTFQFDSIPVNPPQFGTRREYESFKSAMIP